jgi:hypothetical protein
MSSPETEKLPHGAKTPAAAVNLKRVLFCTRLTALRFSIQLSYRRCRSAIKRASRPAKNGPR